jgi:hypothetical protein
MVAAELRLPSKTGRKAKEGCVDAVIAAMGLSKAAGTFIGDGKRRGVSGGERKRASIAVELISNPSLLFLDEPTSGLDSFQAQSVIEVRGTALLANASFCVRFFTSPRVRVSQLGTPHPKCSHAVFSGSSLSLFVETVYPERNGGRKMRNTDD